MHKDFIDKYRNATTAPPSVFCFLYQDLTCDCSAPETAKHSKKQDEICKFLTEVDEPNLLLDFKDTKWESQFHEIWWVLGSNWCYV